MELCNGVVIVIVIVIIIIIEHDGRMLGLPNAPAVMEHGNNRDHRGITRFLYNIN